VANFREIASLVNQISEASCLAQANVALDDLGEDDPLDVSIPAGEYVLFHVVAGTVTEDATDHKGTTVPCRYSLATREADSEPRATPNC